jgi:hypothetical protein
MKRTTFLKILVTAATAGLAASTANASVMTYTSLKCEYSARLVNYDTVRSIRLTNTGTGTVPARATYRIIQATPYLKFNLKLNQALAPKQQVTSPVGYNLGSPRCRAIAGWWIPDEPVR